MAAFARPSAPPTALRFGPASPLDRGGGAQGDFFLACFLLFVMLIYFDFFMVLSRLFFFFFFFDSKHANDNVARISNMRKKRK